MKILIVVPSYFPAVRYGGPIESVHALAKGLLALGHRVTVFTTDADGAGSLVVRTNVPVDVQGVEVWYFERSFPRAWYYSAAMRRALRARTKEFDMVYIVSVFLAASSLAIRAARRAGVPCVLSPRGSLMREPLRRKNAWKKRIYCALVERRNLARAFVLHFTTALEKAEYEAQGFPLRPALVVPNPVDIPPEALSAGRGALRGRLGLADDARVILSLGRINWKKGFDTLIPAFRIVADADPKARLVIAGGDDDGYRATVEGLVRAAGLGGMVFFRGMVLGMEKYETIAAADVFVLPSYAENFGVAVVEALALGIPAVLTPGVALASAVEAAGAGCVAQKDPASFARAIMDLLRAPARRRAMGARGKAWAAQFAPRTVAEALVSAYNQALRP